MAVEQANTQAAGNSDAGFVYTNPFAHGKEHDEIPAREPQARSRRTDLRRQAGSSSSSPRRSRSSRTRRCATWPSSSRPAPRQLAAVLDDPGPRRTTASWLSLLRNAAVAADFVLPFCQDTGTATIVARKGQRVFTGAETPSTSRGESTRRTRERTCATRRPRRSRCTRRQHRDQPAGADRHLRDDGRRTTSCCSRRAAARRTRPSSSRRRARSSTRRAS